MDPLAGRSLDVVGRIGLLRNFLSDSRPSVDRLVAALSGREPSHGPATTMFRVRDGRRESVPVPDTAFRLRTSVEYASPQVTLEELQGIVLARLLEVSATYLSEHPSSPLGDPDLRELSQRLEGPPGPTVVPFLMNVDDIEPDRYSVNPLRRSIVDSGQSGRAVADVAVDGLRPDPAFIEKYSGSLVADADIRDIEAEVAREPRGRYVDLVDRVKYHQLGRLSEELGIDLRIPSYRMPIETLRSEGPRDPLHRLIASSHADLATLSTIYRLFGREIKRRKTLLPAVPHSPERFASKRAANGAVCIEGEELKGVDVHYRPAGLYPNEIDRTDVATVSSESRFSIPWSRLADFDFRETPASPQFALYMIASPEDGAIWHGVGKYAGMQIVQSYTNFHHAFGTGALFDRIPIPRRPSPPQWDIVAGRMLAHPKFGNIDASTNCVDDLVGPLSAATHLRVLDVAAGRPSEPSS